MKDIIVILIITMTLFSSCRENEGNSDKPSKESIEEEKYEIMSLAFDRRMGPDSTRKNRLTPKPYRTNDKNAQVSMERHADSIRKLLDTTRLIVFVTDECIEFQKMPKLTIGATGQGMTKEEHFRQLLGSADTSFVQLLILMEDSSRSEKIQINKIKTGYEYFLRSGDGNPNVKWAQIYAGRISFSAIYFNSSFTLACVYCEYSCGFLCGDDTIYFFKKQNGKWVIVSENRIGVS